MNLYKASKVPKSEKVSENLMDEIDNEEERIKNQWEVFIISFQNREFEAALKSLSDFSNLFYNKTESFVNLAFSMGIPHFICLVVKSEKEEKILKEILKLSLYLLANGSFSTFDFFLQNNFFSSLNIFLDSQNSSLINASLSIISAVLSDFINIHQQMPFDISPQKLSSLLPNLFSYGSIILLIGNMLFEIPGLPNIDEYIKLAFSIFNPYIETSASNRLFNGIIYVFQKNPSQFWPIIQQYLPSINSLVLLKGNEYTETKIETNTNIALKTLCGLIDGPKHVRKAVEMVLPFQDLIFISSASKGEIKYMSMKLLSKSLKYHTSDLSLVFESPAYKSIPAFFNEGEFSEKVGCLFLTISLIILCSDDFRVKGFYDSNFLFIIVDFIDIDHLERSKCALKLILLILQNKPDLLKDFLNEDTFRIIEEARMNSSDKKIADYASTILNLMSTVDLSAN